MGLVRLLAYVLVVVLVVVAVLAGLVLRSVFTPNLFGEIHPHGLEGCKRVGVKEGVVGAEDMILDGDLLFISSDPRHTYW